MAIELKGSAVEQLREIARMAYGSGWKEGTNGGEGYVGMLDGHVVKFCTHRGERGGNVDQEMTKSSDRLREKILRLVSTALLEKEVDTDRINAIKEDVEALMTTGHENEIGEKSLLTRKVVANVINDVQEKLGENLWQDAGEADSSAKLRTDFYSENSRLDYLDIDQMCAQKALAAIDGFVAKLGDVENLYIGEDGGIGKSGDPLGIFLRHAPYRNQHRTTRMAFAEALTSLFGVLTLDKLPENVKAVLKINDFLDNKGHPLSIYRVKAILAEVKKTVTWQRLLPTDAKTLTKLKADPMKILDYGKPVVFDFSKPHLEYAKEQLKADVHKYRDKDIHTNDAYGTLQAMAIDFARNFRLDVKDKEFKGKRDRKLEAGADKVYHKQLLEALDPVFTTPDGSIDVKSRNAFIRIANQNMLANLFVAFEQNSPDSEFSANFLKVPDEVESTVDFDLSQGLHEGTYRLVLIQREKGLYDKLADKKGDVRDFDKPRMGFIEHKVELTFKADEQGELDILEIPLARTTYDFSPTVGDQPDPIRKSPVPPPPVVEDDNASEISLN